MRVACGDVWSLIRQVRTNYNTTMAIMICEPIFTIPIRDHDTTRARRAHHVCCRVLFVLRQCLASGITRSD